MLLKTKLMIGMGAVIVALGTLLFISQKRSARLKVERDQAISFDLARQDTVKLLRQENGMIIAQTEIQELTVRNLRKLQEDERLFWITKFESVNNRLNNVEQASRFTAKVVGDFKIPIQEKTIYVGDSSYQIRTFDNHDEWMRVSGVVTPDTIEVIPFVKVDIKSIVVWRRKKWPGEKIGLRIGRKQYFSESTTDNPYATITSAEITKIGRMRD